MELGSIREQGPAAAAAILLRRQQVREIAKTSRPCPTKEQTHRKGEPVRLLRCENARLGRFDRKNQCTPGGGAACSGGLPKSQTAPAQKKASIAVQRKMSM